MNLSKFLFVLATLLWLPSILEANDELKDSFEESVNYFIEDFCKKCHGNRNFKGDLSLTRFKSHEEVLKERKLWKVVLDAVEGYEMPPKESEKPSPAERKKFISWIRKAIAQPEFGEQKDPGPPLMRRLTRLEYNNTLRDLFGFDVDLFPFPERLPFDKSYFNPAATKLPPRIDMRAREYGSKYPVFLPDAGMPGDSRAEHGFTNRGDHQNLTSVRLEQYLSLAEKIAYHEDLLKRARRLEELFPQAKFESLARRRPPGKTNLDTKGAGLVATNSVPLVTAEGSSRTFQEFNKVLNQAFKENRGGVFSGTENNTTIPGKGGILKVSYGQDELRELVFNPSEDIWSAAFSTADESSGDILFTNRQKMLKKFFFAIQKSENRRNLEVSEIAIILLSRRGQQGLVKVRVGYQDQSDETISIKLTEGAGKNNTFVSFIAPEGKSIQRLYFDGSEFSGDYVLLDDLAFITRDPKLKKADVTGREVPTNETEPTVEKIEVVTLTPLDRSIAQKSVKARIQHFLNRAFRRPLSDQELTAYLSFYEKVKSEKGTDEAAMREVFKATIASPSFLFLTEKPSGGIKELSSYELANKLSYFLWSTMPDDQLFQLATSNQLKNSATLEEQVERMLKHPKVREFSENYFVEWMKLRELWSAQPNRRKFKNFYSGASGKRTLASDMFGEALLFFETLLIENRSILEMLDHDETWVNKRLANHYGLKNVPDTDDRFWHRVKLSDRQRGGILTMASVLTLTSFPERTSPIRRGAWFLETIYNRPPPPPKIAVADIDEQENIDPNLPLRKKVELHRAKKACSVCHDRIDPPGFALESFDAVGRSRTQQNGKAIDASGTLLEGSSFSGPQSFKQAILKNKHRFARGFIEHLLSYALGRKLEYSDDSVVEKIMETTRADDYRLQSIILEIVKSSSFQNIRNPDLKTGAKR